MNLFDVYPLFDIEIVRGDGAWLFDANGQRYLDFYGGHAVISVGHAHPRFLQALNEQAGQLMFYSNSIRNPLQTQLAALLGELSGYPDYNLFLCNSGAEANENAMKIASFHNRRKTFVAVHGAFHGRTSAALSVTDSTSIKAPMHDDANVSFVPLNDVPAMVDAIDEDTCAFIVEGIQGIRGVVEPDGAFLRAARKRCDEVGAMLILDEVQSGCGRTGTFFAHQSSGVRADVITVAKGIGNGYPVAAVLIAPHVEAKHGMLGTTFGGNHLACAAALATLSIIRDEDVMHRCERMGRLLRERIETMPGVVEVRGRGLMLGISFTVPAKRIRTALLNRHRIFTGSSDDPHTLRLLPPMIITEEHGDHFLDALQSVLVHETIEEPIP